jgi:F0F1-type ATP synthase membrane subunit b/b'
MLPLRICLVLAILAGIGVIVLNMVVLKPQFEGIIQVRNDNKTGWDKAEGEKKKLAKTLKETEVELKSTKTDLDATKDQLQATTTKLGEQTKLAVDRAAMIAKLNTQLKAAEDDLAAWKFTGFTVDQIAGLAKQVKDFKLQNEGLAEENKLLKTMVDKRDKEIAVLKGNAEDPPLPATARGKVLVVDPKWDFMVLDVGSKQGLIDRGVLLISRNGTLVAKVRVTGVQQDRCIANIMPGWKLKDVMEGDQVFPYAPTSSL